MNSIQFYLDMYNIVDCWKGHLQLPELPHLTNACASQTQRRPYSGFPLGSSLF